MVGLEARVLASTLKGAKVRWPGRRFLRRQHVGALSLRGTAPGRARDPLLSRLLETSAAWDPSPFPVCSSGPPGWPLVILVPVGRAPPQRSCGSGLPPEPAGAAAPPLPAGAASQARGAAVGGGGSQDGWGPQPGPPGASALGAPHSDRPARPSGGSWGGAGPRSDGRGYEPPGIVGAPGREGICQPHVRSGLW